VSKQALSVTVSPRCIATVRLPKRANRLVSVWYNTECAAGVCVRWIGDGAVVGGWKNLNGSGLGVMYLYPSEPSASDSASESGKDEEDKEERDRWLLIAPG